MAYTVIFRAYDNANPDTMPPVILGHQPPMGERFFRVKVSGTPSIETGWRVYEQSSPKIFRSTTGVPGDALIELLAHGAVGKIQLDPALLERARLRGQQSITLRLVEQDTQGEITKSQTFNFILPPHPSMIGR